MITNYNYIKKMFNIPRGINSYGNIKTILEIKKKIPEIKIKYFKEKKVFDWSAPKRWDLVEGFISETNRKKRIIDSKKNLLHVIQNSTNVKKIISKKELIKYLYFDKKLPNSIPYITSYYKKRWGFALSYNQFKKLNKKKYFIKIKSTFSKKPIPYGEIVFKGKSKKEILLSTYVCHPNLANDNLSGVITLINLANYIKTLHKKNKLYYSYRFIFISETIGSLLYIKKNFFNLKKNIIAGYVITCVGNGKNINFLTKYKENLSYSFLTNFLNYSKFKFTSKNWSSRGSDERQFNSPNIDIPIICITKKKFGEYKQYHSSLDNLNFLKLKDLNHSISFFKKFLKFIEKQKIYKSNIYGEPFLSKRGLFSDISSSYKKISNQDLILDIYDLCDKKNLITDMSKKLKINLKKIQYLIKKLLKNNLIKQL